MTKSLWWHRSWAWGFLLIGLSVVAALMFGRSNWGPEYFSVSVLCLWAWLLFASYLTDYAWHLLNDCRDQLKLRKTWKVPEKAGWFGFAVRGRGVLLFSWIFMLIGLAAGLFGLLLPALASPSTDALLPALLATFSIAVVFWFAGIGFHGACATLGLACTVARRNWKDLYLFHGDRQGGLAPLVRLADVSGLFILSGALALPMGVRIAKLGYTRWKAPAALDGELMHLSSTGAATLGYFTLCVAWAAIGIWALFVIGASVTGRVEIMHALALFRDKEQTALAAEFDKDPEATKTKQDALDNLGVRELRINAWLGGLRNLVVAGAAIFAAIFAAIHAPDQLMHVLGAD